jgi:hypothetical protein
MIRYLAYYRNIVKPFGDPPEVLETAGLDRKEMSRLAREPLSEARLQVLTRTGALHLRGAPTLDLEASVVEAEGGTCVCTVDLVLTQGVELERLSGGEAKPFAAPTWRAQVVGFAPKDDLSLVKEQIGAVVQAFIEDHARD